jgi:hypothetical protein
MTKKVPKSPSKAKLKRLLNKTPDMYDLSSEAATATSISEKLPSTLPCTPESSEPAESLADRDPQFRLVAVTWDP